MPIYDLSFFERAFAVLESSVTYPTLLLTASVASFATRSLAAFYIGRPTFGYML